ncbi:formyltransferase family protein [Spiribacter sp. SSL99]|uniref:formyltransferase family protein n=1 Tax=Spiribacter sp. SSL99 TaxID=1866884 RepID=UPI001330F413|nr:formyltransferase family protein [Spiribacter sp. SSL99]
MTIKRPLCIAGKNRIAVDALNLFINSPLYDVMVCPVASDSGHDSWQPSLRKFVKQLGCRIVSLEEAQKVAGLIFLSLEYDKIIDIDRFANANLFNIHFSYLPAYKGCFTSIWPILNEESVSGVTLHKIDKGIDTGPIVDQRRFDLHNEITAIELYDVYQKEGAALLKDDILIFQKNDLEVVEQSAIGSTYFSRKSLASIPREISPHQTAFQIKKQVRALFFPVYQTATYCSDAIMRCRITDRRSCLLPGTIVSKKDKSVMVSTIDYDVELVKYQH